MTKTYDKMTTNHAKVPLGKSQDPPLGGSVRDCRLSGLKDKKLGSFTLLVLMIGAVFRMLPQNSRKIKRTKIFVFRRENWGIGILDHDFDEGTKKIGGMRKNIDFQGQSKNSQI